MKRPSLRQLLLPMPLPSNGRCEPCPASFRESEGPLACRGNLREWLFAHNQGHVAISLMVDARVNDDTIDGAGVGGRVRSNPSGLGTFGAYSGILNRTGFPWVQNRPESPSHSFRAPAMAPTILIVMRRAGQDHRGRSSVWESVAFAMRRSWVRAPSSPFFWSLSQHVEHGLRAHATLLG